MKRDTRTNSDAPSQSVVRNGPLLGKHRHRPTIVVEENQNFVRNILDYLIGFSAVC
jgi:hypothetical protein